MKLYTLTYDCNTPTKQQINIPTNTDYKVGIKVTRNGKQSILAPSEVLLDTLSADTDKTNGYVTFTESTGDTPSMVEKDIVINKGHDANYYSCDIEKNTTGSTASFQLLSADISEYAGKEVFAKDFYIAFNRSSTAFDEATLSADLIPYWEVPGIGRYAQYKMKPILARANGDYIYSIARDATWQMWIEGWHWPEDKPAFAYFPAGGGQGYFVESFTVKEGDYLTLNASANNNQTIGIIFKFTSGSEWTQSFKLVENVYKSQLGDLESGAQSSGTVTLAGTYSDNTEFSYDLLKA